MPPKRPLCICGVKTREDKSCNTKTCEHYRESRRGAAVAEHQKRKTTKRPRGQSGAGDADVAADPKAQREAFDVDQWVCCTKRLVSEANLSRGTLMACGFSTEQLAALASKYNAAALLVQSIGAGCNSRATAADEKDGDPWQRVVAWCGAARERTGRAALHR